MKNGCASANDFALSTKNGEESKREESKGRKVAVVPHITLTEGRTLQYRWI